jgi:hypothetical protein
MKRHRTRRRDTGAPPLDLRPEGEANRVLDLLDRIDADAGRESITVEKHEATRRELAQFVKPTTPRTT